MTPVVEFKEFEFDPTVEVAPVIYRQEPHRTTSRGIVVGPQATEELLAFAQLYAESLGADNPFFRLDLYITDQSLEVLEVNTAFVDGWGTALNLSRAAGNPIDSQLLTFPRCFGWYGSDAYLPELELLLAELDALGQSHHHICPFPAANTVCDGPIYVYGRVEGPHVWPQNGLVLDNKLNLAHFARDWPGDLVHVPKTYNHEDTDWAAIPGDVFLKFTNKDDVSCERARFSVRRGKPTGKSPFLRQCYNTGALLAQDRIETQSIELDGCKRRIQLVVLTNGQMLAGYVQYGVGEIINDNSIHGPLLFAT